MNVIETKQLCKSYGSHQVLHSIDLAIADGRLIGFLGPNGAGKTTTIRIVMGLLSSTSGEARLFGRPIKTHGKQLRADVGYLPGDVHLYGQMTGQSFLKFLAAARRQSCYAEAERLAQEFELDLQKTIRRFSTGMRQKLGLIQALMHRPKLLVLDEPTSALDPLIRYKVFAELRRVVADGRTVLFSSHSLEEVQTLCDEVVILREGRIVEHQKIEILKKRALRKIQVVFPTSTRADDVAVPPDLKRVHWNDHILCGIWSGHIKSLLDWLQPLQIADVIIEQPDLNDLFISYYALSPTESANHHV